MNDWVYVYIETCDIKIETRYHTISYLEMDEELASADVIEHKVEFVLALE